MESGAAPFVSVPNWAGSFVVLAIVTPVLKVTTAGLAAPVAVTHGINIVVWPVTPPTKLITVTGPTAEPA